MTSTNDNNRLRGAAAERRVAHALNGEIYRGTAGDVNALGHRVEVKSSVGLRGYGKLAAHIDQAIGNVAGTEMPWLLVLTGGKSFHNAAAYALLPLSDLKRLIESQPPDPNRWARIREAVRRLAGEFDA